MFYGNTRGNDTLDAIIKFFIFGISGFFGFDSFVNIVSGNILLAIGAGIIGFILLGCSERIYESKIIDFYKNNSS